MNVLTHPLKKSKVCSEIQTTLNVYFPKMKFNIKDYNEKDYKIIEISYTDGISSSRVKNAIKYINRPADPNINIKGIKIEISRDMSLRIKNIMLGEIKNVFNLKVIPNENDWIQQINSTARDYINRIFNMRDFD